MHGDRKRLIDQVQSRYGQGFARDPALWTDAPALRTALGKAAKTGGWFKRQDRGQEWVGAIRHHLDDPYCARHDLVRKLGVLRAWLDDA